MKITAILMILAVVWVILSPCQHVAVSKSHEKSSVKTHIPCKNPAPFQEEDCENPFCVCHGGFAPLLSQIQILIPQNFPVSTEKNFSAYHETAGLESSSGIWQPPRLS